MLVATDYSTKWTKVVPLKNMTHNKVIEFITEHIIYRFNISQTLTMDLRDIFCVKEGAVFCQIIPYYAQANGQA